MFDHEYARLSTEASEARVAVTLQSEGNVTSLDEALTILHHVFPNMPLAMSQVTKVEGQWVTPVPVEVRVIVSHLNQEFAHTETVPVDYDYNDLDAKGLSHEDVDDITYEVSVQIDANANVYSPVHGYYRI